MIGTVYMISHIPPDDKKSYGTAMKLYNEKYHDHMTDYLRAAHFNGDPFALVVSVQTALVKWLALME